MGIGRSRAAMQDDAGQRGGIGRDQPVLDARGIAERGEGHLRAMGGGKIHNVKDPVYDGSDGCLAIAMDAPESDWEKLAR